jgi:hypothetical protein
MYAPRQGDNIEDYKGHFKLVRTSFENQAISSNISKFRVLESRTLVQLSHVVDVISIGSMGIDSAMNLCPIPWT